MKERSSADPAGEPPRARPCPRLVAVSDGTRLSRPDALARIEMLIRADCPAILLRPGTMSARSFQDLARLAEGACRGLGAELWIGDRSDVALSVGAAAVQLPARGLSLRGARRVVGEEMRVGRSVHSPGEAARAAAEGADHVVLGTVFATASHPGAAPGGAALIRDARAAIEAEGRAVPILAIGGITPRRVADVLAAGAWGVAALSALWDVADPEAAVRAFRTALGGETPRRALH